MADSRALPTEPSPPLLPEHKDATLLLPPHQEAEHPEPAAHAEHAAPDAHGAEGSGTHAEAPRGHDKERPPNKRHLGWLYVVSALLVVASIVGAIVIRVRHNRREARIAAELNRKADLGPEIAATKAQRGAAERTVMLPADARAVQQTTIYAKTSGYVREIRVNRGDRVKQDDVLAILESPETDQQVSAARADLNLKQKLAARARALAAEGIASQQDRETAEANLEVSKTALARLLALAAYQTIRAPFAGVVTARYVDTGALLPAATGATQAAMPLVDLADTDTLKATIYLGQDVTPFVRAGDPVELWQDERPEQKIQASLTRLSGALDPRTRTMLAEIELDNRKFNIYPGTFVHVRLNLKSTPLPMVPSDAIFVRKGALLVGRLEDDHVRFTPVQIGVNDGRTTQILSGLEGGEDIALNVPSEVNDGARVHVVQAPAPAPSASASASAGPAAGAPPPPQGAAVPGR